MAPKKQYVPRVGSAVASDGTILSWSLTRSGVINIGTTSDRLTARLLKGDTEDDAERRVEARLQLLQLILRRSVRTRKGRGLTAQKKRNDAQNGNVRLRIVRAKANNRKGR